MSFSDGQRLRSTSPTYDYFQMMFQGADVYSSLWQPMLKGVGRWHLEVANLNAKQSQAALQWSRDVSRSWNPADLMSANSRFWQSVSTQYADSSGRIADNVTRTVQVPLISEVVPLPTKRSHDTLSIPDPAALPDRKVA